MSQNIYGLQSQFSIQDKNSTQEQTVIFPNDCDSIMQTALKLGSLEKQASLPLEFYLPIEIANPYRSWIKQALLEFNEAARIKFFVVLDDEPPQLNNLKNVQDPKIRELITDSIGTNGYDTQSPVVTLFSYVPSITPVDAQNTIYWSYDFLSQDVQGLLNRAIKMEDHLYETDMYLNATFFENLSDDTIVHYLKSVVQHEASHALGLIHTEGLVNEPESIMEFYHPERAISQRDIDLLYCTYQDLIRMQPSLLLDPI